MYDMHAQNQAIIHVALPCLINISQKGIVVDRVYGQIMQFLPLPSADSVIHRKMCILFIPFDMIFFSSRLATNSRSCPPNMVGETICSNLQKLAIY